MRLRRHLVLQKEYINELQKNYISPRRRWLECTARVVSCTPNKNDGYDLETDRTPFFPEGGGQLSDIGTVYDPMQGFVPVTHCFEANGTVLHRTGKPFSVGEIVTLKVDAAKRLKYTQQHTGRTPAFACL